MMGGEKNNGTIWVIDDDSGVRHMLEIALKSKDYHVRVFEDGNVALKALEAEKPDLILLDVMMPAISGYDVLKEIRNRYSLSDLPVVLLTAKGLAEDIKQGLSLDANDYIVKPFEQAEFFERVRIHIRIKTNQDRLQEAARSQESLNRYARAIAANIWIVGLVLVLGLVGTYLYVSSLTPIYRAESSVVITFEIPTDSLEALQGFQDRLPDLIAGSIDVLRSDPVRQSAFADLSGAHNQDDLGNASVDISLSEGSWIADISVESSDPLLARDLANELAAQAQSLSGSSGIPESFSFVLLDEALAPGAPIFPNLPRALLLGGLASIVVGGVIALLVGIYRDQRHVQAAA
jgi:CheY-like chemotaxis protein